MIMTEDVQVGLFNQIPLCNCLIGWYKKTTDTTLVTYSVTVVKANFSAHYHLRIVVTLANKKSNPFKVAYPSIYFEPNLSIVPPGTA